MGEDGETRPFILQEVEEVSRTRSAATDRRYGVELVCRVWGQARSSFYARRRSSSEGAAPMRRGPAPFLTDEELLEHVRADLAASPFSGEGHRKVWARLRVRRGIRVARKRVLRLMREHKLLSPCRSRQSVGNPHQGEIVTKAPNEMWGTDGVRILTVEDGWVWLFSAVEHWNGECVGWHACKRGDRYAALEPISQGLKRVYGSLEAQVARGLALRMDHGTQYLSDHFVNQIRFWGIETSYAFLEQPQRNGVAERFHRTLKEQIVHGRVFRNLGEVRAAVRAFVELYNREWLLEKSGYLSPLETRRLWPQTTDQRAAD